MADDKKLVKYSREWINGDLYIIHNKSNKFVLRVVKLPKFLGVFGKTRFKVEFVAKPDLNAFESIVEAELFSESLLKMYEKIFKTEEDGK